MKNIHEDSEESMIRVRTTRKGAPVELRVHYAVDRLGGCDTYRILLVEDHS